MCVPVVCAPARAQLMLGPSLSKSVYMACAAIEDHDDVYGPCYSQGPFRYLWSVQLPETMWKFMTCAAADGKGKKASFSWYD